MPQALAAARTRAVSPLAPLAHGYASRRPGAKDEGVMANVRCKALVHCRSTDLSRSFRDRL